MPLRSLLHNFRARKTARWEIEYSAVITAPQGYKGWLILPLPRATSHQQLLGEITFSIRPTSTGQDATHGNAFGAWKVNLGADEPFTVSARYQIEKIAIKETVSPEWTLGDYKKVDPALYAKYTAPNRFVSGENPAIRKIAAELIGEETNVQKIISRCNEYVITSLSYGNPIPGLYSVAQALDNKCVDCGGYDTLFISLLNACGIPARVVSGFWLGDGKSDMHAWAAVLLPDGNWLKTDPSVEHLRRQGRTKKIGSLGITGSDRLVLSTGSDIEIEVRGQKIKLDILQNPELYPAPTSAKVTRSITTKHL